MGKLWIFGNNKRPLVGEQNTGRDVYERPLGTGTVSVEGNGGANNYRSLNPFNLSSINPQYVAMADISGAGSANGLSTNPLLRPLIDKSTDANAVDGGIGIGAGGTTIQF
jgi:hypothetical protein